MKNKISLIDWVQIHILSQIPDTPKVRAYLNEVADLKADKQKTKGLIQTSNGIVRVK